MSITRINNNIAAITANRNLDATSRDLQQSIERLSSGLRINNAGDDAAGLTIATRIRSQVRGLDRAVMNAQDGINLVNIAEGAMEEMVNRLDRIRVLAIQAANTGVNDLLARQALQDEVFQSIDEITRIANTTKYSANLLLNGDYSVVSEIKAGQDYNMNYGISIDSGPSSSTLESGVSYLNIIRTENGFAQLIPGLDSNGVSRTMHLGTNDATDIAVSVAHFSDARSFGGRGSVAGDGFDGEYFNGVSIAARNSMYDVFQFDGYLADGVTKFFGTFSLSGAAQFGVSTDTVASDAAASLVGSINRAIDNAEKALFGVTTTASVPTSFRTTVTIGTGANLGRLLLYNEGNYINQSEINVSMIRGGNVVSQAAGVTRSEVLGRNSILSGGGQIGNSITAITGSTFTTGEFEITVNDVKAAQNRTLESTIIFRDGTGATLSRTASLVSTTRGLSLNGTFVDGIYTGGVSISNGDTLSLRGTDVDGATFESVYTFSDTPSTDTDLNDFQFASLSGLIAELNYRTRDYTINSLDGKKTRFDNALFTLSADGKLQLIDDLGRDDSQLDFTFTFNDSNSSATPAYTINDDADLIKEGFAESASISINGGEAVRAKAGEVITLNGQEATKEGEVPERVTLRVGSNLKVGKDILDTQAQEFIGRLNGGPAVTFQNGAQDVEFIDDETFASGVARILTVDFDTILDITKSATDEPDPGVTLLISTINSSLNFQIGAFSDEYFRTSIGNLTAEYLGFANEGRTVETINVTTLSGANEALEIVDKALDQINRTRSLLGAATNRMEGTIANLSVSSENLLAAESRLRDADFAKETSAYASSQVLLQAGVSVLAQANFLPQSFLSLLG